MSKKTVLVLNAGMEPLHNVTPEHAIRMIDKGKATVLKEDPDKSFRSTSGVEVLVPKVMVLTRYIVMDWYYSKPLIWSKSGIMRRDNRRCAYCHSAADTIDHVWPVCKGGKSTWQNTVAACFKCNNKKSDRTLDEMGWTLPFVPTLPNRHDLVLNYQ